MIFIKRRTPNTELFTKIVADCLDPHINIHHEAVVDTDELSEAGTICHLRLFDHWKWTAFLGLFDGEDIALIVVDDEDPTYIDSKHIDSFLEVSFSQNIPELNKLLRDIDKELDEFDRNRANELSFTELKAECSRLSEAYTKKVKDILSNVFANTDMASMIEGMLYDHAADEAYLSDLDDDDDEDEEDD